MNDDVPVSEMPQPTGRRNARMRQTVRDMVLSLALVIGVVAVIMLITWRPQPDAVKVVDVTQALTAARTTAGYPVLIPTDTGNLQPTSARWEPTKASAGIPVWHVGYVADGNEYVQVSQAATEDPAYLAEQTAGGHPGETVYVMGNAWEQRESSDRRSLVRIDGGVTTVVSGTVGWDQLTTIAASLSDS